MQRLKTELTRIGLIVLSPIVIPILWFSSKNKAEINAYFQMIFDKDCTHDYDGWA